jgi:predicted RNA-binding protein with PUA-like domain
LKPLKNPVTLAEVKKDKRLKNIGLVRIGRLSVMPLTKDEFDVILEWQSSFK